MATFTDESGNVWYDQFTIKELRKMRNPTTTYVWFKGAPNCDWTTPHDVHKVSISNFLQNHAHYKGTIWLLQPPEFLPHSEFLEPLEPQQPQPPLEPRTPLEPQQPQPPPQHFWTEFLLPIAFILGSLAAVILVVGTIANISYANWETAKWVYLAGIVGSVGFTIGQSPFRKEVFGSIVFTACFGAGLYALTSIFGQKSPIASKTISKKKVSKAVETQEIKKIAEDGRKIAGDFIQSFPEQSLFRQKTLTYKNPKTNSLETIELSPEVSLNRVKNSLGVPVDSVLASYSYWLKTEPVNPSIQGTSTLETEVRDYPSGEYLLQHSKLALELLDGVKYSVNNFLKPHYLDKSQGLDVTITGWADSSAITGSLPYKGEYGNISDIYYTDTLSRHSKGIQMKAGEDITSNEVLAYLRSKGARNYLDEKTEVGHFRGTKNYFQNAIAYQKAQGGQFRKVQIKLKIENKNLPSVSPTPPLVKEPEKECWVCKFISLWISGGIMTVCAGLFMRHHKKIETDKKNIGYHKNWRNGSIIVALIAAIAYALC
jgi:hypothetical protein